MTDQPRRFYENATIEGREDGHALLLDGSSVKTPAGHSVILPTAALADAVAAEWRVQEETIDPASMPLTRLANTAIDRVADDPGAVADVLAAYAETDLLCYRAASPEELADLQAREWAPWLTWAEERFGVRLAVSRGLTPVEQPAGDLETLSRAVHAFPAWELTAVSEIITLTGSLILGLAVSEDALSEQEAWRISHLDEEFQAERWGRTPEAEDRRRERQAALAAAVRFLALCRS